MKINYLSSVRSSFNTTGGEQFVVFLFMFGKFTASIGFAVVYVYHVEFFLTPTRQTVMRICSAYGRIGGIISLFILHSGLLLYACTHK